MDLLPTLPQDIAFAFTCAGSFVADERLFSRTEVTAHLMSAGDEIAGAA